MMSSTTPETAQIGDTAEASEYPDSWNCPISMTLMRDPVIGPDGVTYERRAIEDWLKTSNRSPVTREVMPSTSLIPNRALKDTIWEALGGTGLLDSSVPLSTSVSPAKPEGLDLNCSWEKHPLTGSTLCHVKVTPPLEGKRKPVTFICVLDVSYSMGIEASLPAEDVEEESVFSRLDLVKHSMNTVIASLGEEDKLAVVSFSASACVELAATPMNATGKESAKRKVGALKPMTNTNLWDGLRQGMTLASEADPSSNVVILLLTDGEANVNPPRGLIPTLKKWLELPVPTYTIHTFGFGYSLDSAQLSEISKLGCGSFAYIPDCSMVGTVFVNFLSNILATAFRQVKVRIEAEGYNANFLGYAAGEYQDNTVSLGLVQYGQARDVSIELIPNTTVKPTNSNCVSVSSLDLLEQKKLSIDVQSPQDDVLHFETARLLLIETIQECIRLGKNDELSKAQEKLETIQKLFGQCEDITIKELLKDIQGSSEDDGQIEKAMAKSEWFKNWGEHYLRSVINAHKSQTCNNFKDSGVQVYGGNLFRTIQSMTENLFLTIAPPNPSVRKLKHGRRGSPDFSATRSCPVPPASMSRFYAASAGCFHGSCRVLLADGSYLPLPKLRRGDVVKTKGGTTACVRCLVIYETQDESAVMTQVGNLLITPWHPIRINDQWVFPRVNYPTSTMRTSHVYNLVLESGHTVFVDGIECCTLAHNFVEPVVQHDYFGTDRVVEDLKQMRGWNEGIVNIGGKMFARDSVTRKVQQLV